MLGYISSTRRKSCGACVKSKRRCDLGYPCCKRCFSKGLVCQYRGFKSSDPLSQAEVVVRQTTPEESGLPSPPEIESVPTPPDVARVLVDVVDPSLFLEAQYTDAQFNDLHNLNFSQFHPCQSLLINEPQLWQPVFLNNIQVNYLVGKLSAFVRSLAYAGSTPFMHEVLYQDWQPPAYQDACALSALYLMKTPKNKTIIVRTIISKISSLLSSSILWSLVENLAAVQALIIYQIVRMFDGDLNQRPLIDQHNTLLAKWTDELWTRSFNEPQSFKTQHQRWVFYESLRRTVMISAFLRGAWSCVKTGGFCDQVGVLHRLPITHNAQLWDLEEDAWTLGIAGNRSSEAMMPYDEYSEGWDASGSGNLGEYERLLLVACKGEVAIDSTIPRVMEV
ncbi:hypothetical protein AOQ84DRAFT_384152 [Glonium stellatum]|uniref:Zn(2)-C6 fungal-type domain-containing protein n=1 Tax=Glonium stellatum TaxID=574774 RepID=A0A8E2FF21_9PEZI|nr:hypothetical protein AOQ84DRAFT_384152 [Glonium stellatum]